MEIDDTIVIQSERPRADRLAGGPDAVHRRCPAVLPDTCAPVGVLKRSISLPRPDVVEALSAKFGLFSSQCGFVAFVADAIVGNEPVYLEIELSDGVGRLQGRATAHQIWDARDRRILEVCPVTADSIQACFDNVLGPAVEGLNKDRLKGPRLAGRDGIRAGSALTPLLDHHPALRQDRFPAVPDGFLLPSSTPATMSSSMSSTILRASESC